VKVQTPYDVEAQSFFSCQNPPEDADAQTTLQWIQQPKQAHCATANQRAPRLRATSVFLAAARPTAQTSAIARGDQGDIGGLPRPGSASYRTMRGNFCAGGVLGATRRPTQMAVIATTLVIKEGSLPPMTSFKQITTHP